MAQTQTFTTIAAFHISCLSVDDYSCESVLKISTCENEPVDVELKYRSILEFKKLIHMSLFKIFIENKVNIHTFDTRINFPYIDDMLELMLKA
ncbi:hypothetical protein RhiirA5_435751 [Rhizophagus irregularis]|uniref:Uncharacterized protein n=1 Tax=Rhizophagus irregularis TaxID=588596 RepID=A0A2N0NMX8_9GLOM|nr:hypothetical protein RhiirA5_435751 [Rhizophagus irregularis]